VNQATFITERELVELLVQADRFAPRDGVSLPPLTAALAEIWALMIYENTDSIERSKLSGTQLAAWDHAHQLDMVPALTVETS